jgi:hypothetical protein
VRFQVGHLDRLTFEAEGDALQEGELSFSTGPGTLKEATHWKQSVLLLKRPLNGSKGELCLLFIRALTPLVDQVTNGHIKFSKDTENRRHLNIEIRYQDGEVERTQNWQLK